ncbi:hypothetical protein [Herbidospora daliensis]|uniref:hypothetical protein n=1 Tax=Herbidospora daliensis TaxID=295585 RepID=UPI0012FA2C63|nr:hypothetical protein [Herbidospora daliensis]
MITFIGLLSLARMRPVIDMASCPLVPEIDAIIDSGKSSPGKIPSDVIRSVEGWYSGIEVIDDDVKPLYFQVTAVHVALTVASEVLSPREREWRVNADIKNFWKSCDSLLHAGGGFTSPVYSGIKTTMEGVEDVWIEQDVKSFKNPRSDVVVEFGHRLAAIRSNYPKRVRIARLIAKCAGWPIPPHLAAE